MYAIVNGCIDYISDFVGLDWFGYVIASMIPLAVIMLIYKAVGLRD